jgi:hypothetical protein
MEQPFQDLCDDMGRADQIYVMATHALQAEHNISKPLCRNPVSFTSLADLPILTKQASQVAVAKKNRP